jgi:hypothetical protein
VCEADFAPLKPSGSSLIFAAHGAVTDEHRERIEKAIRTLPMQVQAQVWEAFNVDGLPAEDLHCPPYESESSQWQEIFDVGVPLRSVRFHSRI